MAAPRVSAGRTATSGAPRSLAHMNSPLLTHTGAVPAEGRDAGVASHYGDPHAEQRALARSAGVVDRSNRGVVRITGADRLSWLHSLTTQYIEHLAPGETTLALILSPQGHVEHHLTLTDDGAAVWAHAEPGTAGALLSFLRSMRFLLRVEPADVTAELERDGVALAGLAAYEALRIAAHRPRLGLDTDHRTIPHEVGWIETAVNLTKGCYRGQETVARVHNLGHPPRRLVFLHLDGSEDRLPAPGDPVTLDGAPVGFTGSVARHFEQGPIALALIKRTVPVEAGLTAGGVPAAQEVIVPPDAGANVKVTLRRRQLS